MIYPLYHTAYDGTAELCQCGFALVLSPNRLHEWFGETGFTLETGCLSAATPCEHSGKSGSFEGQTRLRLPVCKSIGASGTFLDVGYATSFPPECVVDWTGRKLELTRAGVLWR